jgi:hypothetical protein
MLIVSFKLAAINLHKNIHHKSLIENDKSNLWRNNMLPVLFVLRLIKKLLKLNRALKKKPNKQEQEAKIGLI